MPIPFYRFIFWVAISTFPFEHTGRYPVRSVFIYIRDERRALIQGKDPLMMKLHGALVVFGVCLLFNVNAAAHPHSFIMI